MNQMKSATFYTLDGDSAKLPGSMPDGTKEPVCIRRAGRCPRLQKIENRLCEACRHHHYVKVLGIANENEWQKVRCQVLDKNADYLEHWLPFEWRL
eukprot:m.67461 g.67461  ORF g.67461 m.67461 type:complete len:96 (+) comp35446_c0_seq3:1-288(+)